jgi:hypothetical protein
VDAQDIGQQMDDPVRIALVGDYPNQLVGDAQPPLRLSEQHHGAVEGDKSAIEGGPDLLRAAAGRSKSRAISAPSRSGCLPAPPFSRSFAPSFPTPTTSVDVEVNASEADAREVDAGGFEPQWDGDDPVSLETSTN